MGVRRTKETNRENSADELDAFGNQGRTAQIPYSEICDVQKKAAADG
jgi:hypothetical protein